MAQFLTLLYVVGATLFFTHGFVFLGVSPHVSLALGVAGMIGLAWVADSVRRPLLDDGAGECV